MLDATTPPRGDRPLAAEDVPSPLAKWAMPVGITLVTYAILGSLVVLLAVAAGFAAPMLMKLAMPSGEPPAMPPVLLWFIAISGAVSVGLGVLLAVGGMGIVGQRRRGVERVRRWAVIRLVLAAVGLVVSWVLLPTQLEYNKLMHEWQIVAANDPRVREAIGDYDAARDRRTTSIGQASGVVIVSIMPFATLIFLSRRKVQAQIETWDA